MKNQHPVDNNQTLLIETCLRTGGYLFPETIAEVEAFERIYGTTDVHLPEHLMNPNFVTKSPNGKKKSNVVSMQNENYAMAAREGVLVLSDEIQKKMKEDRRKADAMANKSNKK